MKYLIIDDNESFAKQLFKLLTGEQSNSENDNKHLPCEKLYDLALSIKNNINSNNDVVLCINVNLKFGKDSRQLQMGIELLIWLRIMNVMNHCILYSFEDLHSLLNREPKYLIATSQGTTFVQFPNNFSSIQKLLEKKKKEEKIFASEDNIKATLKPAINIESIRHKEANWWGIKQVWDVHRIVKASPKKEFPYPSGVLIAEKDLESKICQMLYQADESKLGRLLKTNSRLRKGDFIHISKKDREYSYLIDDSNYNDFTTEIIIKSLHHELNKRSPKILHIDDQWSDGWGEILCEMIYGGIANKLQQTVEVVISHKWNDKLLSVKPTESDFANIHEYLKNLELDNFDLIILDLRLDPDKDKHKNKERYMSGALFLQEIRNLTKGIPVLMTTASNKIWSYQELNKLGADAYWMKAGVDNFNDAENTVTNYHKLLFNIERLTNSSRQNLNSFYKKLDELTNNNNLWWKKKIEWKREINTTFNLHNYLPSDITIPQQTNTESYELDSEKKKDIIVCFEQILVKLRNYLMSYELDFECLADDQVLSWHLRGIINDIGAICEIIHNNSKLIGSQIGGFVGSDKIEINRGDWIAQLLYILRNKASHYSESKEITMKNVFRVIEYTFKWLESPQVYKLPSSTAPALTWGEIEAIIESCLTPNQP